jgi:sister-chromatid-cohesion protein PDS5
LCLVKLAKVKDYDRELTSTFEKVVGVALDDSEVVRHKFLVKLGEVLPAQRMLPRWNMIPALSATDPESENIALVSFMSRLWQSVLEADDKG